MFNATQLVIDGFLRHIHDAYTATYSNLEPSFPGLIEWAGRMALERISNTDCLYHNAEHTILVTLVGQEVLRGKQMRERSVRPRDWVHTMISLLCHDIGYVRGICMGDEQGSYVINEAGDKMAIPRGGSDAALTPYHVTRGQIFVRERFENHPIIDVEAICENIERTRFPMPDKPEYRCTDDLPSLVRAADLIGQLADPMYLCKIGALFAEFEETGTNKSLGYHSAADLAAGYPKFYWNIVHRLVQPHIQYLRMTHEGKQWVANLYAHVFAAEHGEPVLGPEQS